MSKTELPPIAPAPAPRIPSRAPQAPSKTPLAPSSETVPAARQIAPARPSLDEIRAAIREIREKHKAEDLRIRDLKSEYEQTKKRIGSLQAQIRMANLRAADPDGAKARGEEVASPGQILEIEKSISSCEQDLHALAVQLPESLSGGRETYKASRDGQPGVPGFFAHRAAILHQELKQFEKPLLAIKEAAEEEIQRLQVRAAQIPALLEQDLDAETLLALREESATLEFGLIIAEIRQIRAIRLLLDIWPQNDMRRHKYHPQLLSERSAELNTKRKSALFGNVVRSVQHL